MRVCPLIHSNSWFSLLQLLLRSYTLLQENWIGCYLSRTFEKLLFKGYRKFQVICYYFITITLLCSLQNQNNKVTELIRYLKFFRFIFTTNSNTDNKNVFDKKNETRNSRLPEVSIKY